LAGGDGVKKKVLITGGTGYLGYKIAKRLLATSDEEVVLWLRARDAQTFATRRSACERLFADDAGRVSYGWGDLSMPAPFESVDGFAIKTILHPAADTRFNIDAETANVVNVAGTQKLLAFARRCPALDCVAIVSSIYAAGLSEGSIGEVLLGAEVGFANHYERSKWASERSVDDYADLPWRVFRTGTVLADDDSGVVLQYNIAHKVKRLMFAGLLPIFPGVAGMPIYFVTGDFVADAMCALAQRSQAHAVYNVCHTAEDSLTLGRWLEQAYDCFMGTDEFASRHVMRPIMTELDAFRCLAASVEAFSRDVEMQAVVKLVNPFAEQMFVAKHVRNDRLRTAFPQYRAPDPAALLARVCAHLAETQWGARSTSMRLWEA
jgi:thioester reductase-like protein